MVSYPHRVSSGADPKTIIILTEGDDYDLEEGAPVLTEAGFQRMGQAHANGFDVIIKFDQIVIFGFPANA
jgi:hypothetical protein